MLDVIDGILPAVKEDDDFEQYEEERRLFYVGITRARNKLYLFSIKQQESRFEKEIERSIPAEIHEPDDFSSAFHLVTGKKYYTEDQTWTILAQCEDDILLEKDDGSLMFSDLQTMLKNRRRRYSLKISPQEREQIHFKRGMQLRHRTYGIGKVTRVQGNIMIVDFGTDTRSFSIRACLKKHLIEPLEEE